MADKVIVQRPPKSPALAGILAFFFPFGVGAFYNRNNIKGIVYLFLFAALVTIQTTGTGQPFWGLILAGFYFYQIIESVQDAKRINKKALEGEDYEEPGVDDLPELVKAGSVFWGIVLIVLGAVFLLANFDVISYDILWDLWPVAVIGIGAKFIYDYTKENKKKD